MNEQTNGNGELHDERKAAVSYGLEQFQRMSQEREEAIRVRDELQIKMRGYQVAMEAQDARILDLESRCSSLTIERDAAVAHRTKWEALFTSVLAQLRAFEVPNEPLIRDKTNEQLASIVAAQQNFRPQGDALEELKRLTQPLSDQQRAAQAAPVVRTFPRWCPGCSQEVAEPCKHFMCPVGPNRTD